MFKKLHLENHCSRSVNIYTKDSLYGENLVAPRQKWGPRWGSKFKIYRQMFKSLLKNYMYNASICDNTMQAS